MPEVTISHDPATASRDSGSEIQNSNVVVLSSRLAEVRAAALLADVIKSEFAGRIALVSSFGAESAVLLHLISRIDTATPVIFIDTGRLFGETAAYRDTLVARLGLTNIRTATPDATLLGAQDPDKTLYQSDPDRCCTIRKVAPLTAALNGFDAWITGRKRFHGGDRNGLPMVEADDSRVKINPLSDWSRDDIDAYIRRHDLPAHPLVAEGYSSIGCEPCTSPTGPGEGARDGRWRGSGKTECGIHFGSAGRVRTASAPTLNNENGKAA
ncbi:MAG: phosphoadenylyl-sulfate reductase [Alphaproteobacteria bacterium]